MTFRVTFLCDDKHVAALMHGLSNVARDLSVLPAENVVIVNGKAKAETEDGDVVSKLKIWLRKQRLAQVTAAQLKQFQRDHHRAPSGYSYTLRAAQKAGLLKKQGKKGNWFYRVMKQGASI